MPSQRFILTIGFAVLLAISAATIALDLKTRSDDAWVDHTYQVLGKISNLRMQGGRAESAARGYLFENDPRFLAEFRDSVAQTMPALRDLQTAIGDNPAQLETLAGVKDLITQRLGVLNTLIERHAKEQAGSSAAPKNGIDGSILTLPLIVKFDQLSAGERTLLAHRESTLRLTRLVLNGVTLAGAAVILILAALLVRRSRQFSQKQEAALRMTEAENEMLETAVRERTAHLETALENLRQSTSVLNSSFASMAEAVLVLDQNGIVLLANAAAEHAFAARIGAAMDKLNRIHTVRRAGSMEELLKSERPSVRALRGESFDGLEYTYRRLPDDALRHFLASGRPLYGASGTITGATLILHDITETRETERKLQQSQKLEAIGRLTGGVAHDFNNMLTVITGTTEGLADGLAKQPELLSAVNLIDQAAARCAELIQHLLAFAERQPLQPRSVDINATISDTMKLLRPTLGEQIEIACILPQGIAAAHIDHSQLVNALINLAINARDAMPKGGKLLFETQNITLDEIYASQNTDVQAGPYVMIAVSDTGTGIAADLLDKIFEPFFTTKEIGKGSGLGLSMVYQFVKQSGGHIKVYSEEGHGTTIKLYLVPAQSPAEGSRPKPQVETGGSETILVVEDDMLVRNSVIAQLKSLGYQIITASDGRSALALVEAGTSFDLLFTDIVMPGGMTGRQLADEVIRRRPGTKVLYTSGYTENAIVHHGRLDAGVLLLTKPYRKAALAAMVRRAIDDTTSTPSE